MATKTRRDLVNEALINLGVLAAGQVADAEDFDAVDDKVEPFVEWMREADIYDLDNVEEIPLSVFLQLAVLLADECALMFGLPGVPKAPNDPIDAVSRAIHKIKLVTYARPTGERLRTEYF